MSELEWYLDVGGKQSGPHTAKEIVDLVRAGKIPAASQVTAARMSGDWVTAQDLVDAYSELYAKTTVPMPMDGATVILGGGAPTHSDPNFKAPPRPTEQLEASRIIYLNQEGSNQGPDPTDALFQAIQAVREKAALKNVTTAPQTSSATNSRDSSGQQGRREIGPRVTPQLMLIGTLAVIFAVTLYGISLLLHSKEQKKSEAVEAKTSVVAPVVRNPAPAAITVPPAQSLLNDDSSGAGSGRANGVTRPATPYRPPTTNRGNDGLEAGGGARYRDERDDMAAPPRIRMNRGRGAAPLEDADVEEPDDGAEPGEMTPAIAPVDPSQVAPDKANPDLGGGIPADNAALQQ